MTLKEFLKEFVKTDYDSGNEMLVIGYDKYNRHYIKNVVAHARIYQLKNNKNVAKYYDCEYINVDIIGEDTTGVLSWYIQIKEKIEPKQLTIFDII